MNDPSNSISEFAAALERYDQMLESEDVIWVAGLPKGVQVTGKYCAPCILPYSKCVYQKATTKRRPMAFCDDIEVGPHNSDAKCFKVTWKKQMIERSLDSGVALVSLDKEEE